MPRVERTVSLKKPSITGDGTLCPVRRKWRIDRFGSTCEIRASRHASEVDGPECSSVSFASETQATPHPPMLVPQMRSNMSHAGFHVSLSILRMIVEIVYPFVPPPSMHMMRSGRGPSNAPSSRGIPPARWAIHFRHAVAATLAPPAADETLRWRRRASRCPRAARHIARPGSSRWNGGSAASSSASAVAPGGGGLRLGGGGGQPADPARVAGDVAERRHQVERQPRLENVHAYDVAPTGGQTRASRC